MKTNFRNKEKNIFFYKEGDGRDDDFYQNRDREEEQQDE